MLVHPSLYDGQGLHAWGILGAHRAYTLPYTVTCKSQRSICPERSVPKVLADCNLHGQAGTCSSLHNALHIMLYALMLYALHILWQANNTLDASRSWPAFEAVPQSPWPWPAVLHPCSWGEPVTHFLKLLLSYTNLSESSRVWLDVICINQHTCFERADGNGARKEKKTKALSEDIVHAMAGTVAATTETLFFTDPAATALSRWVLTRPQCRCTQSFHLAPSYTFRCVHGGAVRGLRNVRA